MPAARTIAVELSGDLLTDDGRLIAPKRWRGHLPLPLAAFAIAVGPATSTDELDEATAPLVEAFRSAVEAMRALGLRPTMTGAIGFCRELLGDRAGGEVLTWRPAAR